MKLVLVHYVYIGKGVYSVWTDSVPNVDSHLTPPPATPSGPPGQPGTRVVWPSPSVFGDLSPM